MNIITCPVCGKVLTPETNNEACPNSPYWHGKHPLFVMDFTEFTERTRHDHEKDAQSDLAAVLRKSPA